MGAEFHCWAVWIPGAPSPGQHPQLSKGLVSALWGLISSSHRLFHGCLSTVAWSAGASLLPLVLERPQICSTKEGKSSDLEEEVRIQEHELDRSVKAIEFIHQPLFKHTLNRRASGDTEMDPGRRCHSWEAPGSRRISHSRPLPLPGPKQRK